MTTLEELADISDAVCDHYFDVERLEHDVDKGELRIARYPDPGVSTLDLMVDDLDDIHEVLDQMDANPGPIIPGNPHDTFTVSDPEGKVVLIESSHVTGPV